MIQFSAPAPTGAPATPGGTAPAASAKTSGNGGFAALLGMAAQAETTGDAGPAADAALLLPGGNPGKPSGKILPDGEAGEDGADEDAALTPAISPPPTVQPPALLLVEVLPAPPAITATAPVPAAGSNAAGNAGNSSALPSPVPIVQPYAAALAGAVASPPPTTAPILANAAQPAAATLDPGRVRLASIEVIDETAKSSRPPPKVCPLAGALPGREQSPAAPSPQAPVGTPVPAPALPGAALAPPASSSAEHAAPGPGKAASHAAEPAEAVPTPPAQDLPVPTIAPANGMPPSPADTANSARLAAAIAPAAEAPQDFAALMGRLSEAREAASPHFVRTTLSHAEFGPVSLEFRHEDRGLSVTMASAAPGFNGAVQNAVAATLASGAQAGTQGDQPRDSARQDASGTPQNLAHSGGSAGNGGASDQRQQAAFADARAGHERQPSGGRQGASRDRRGHEDAAPDRAARDAGRSGLYA